MPKHLDLVDDLETFKVNCESFVSGVEFSDFEYDDDEFLKFGCHYKQEEECGISSCHQNHKKGFIIGTKCGKYFNIGQDCGKKYFGVKFDEWFEGLEAQIKKEAHKVTLRVSPERLLQKLADLEPKLLKVEKANQAIWQYLSPLAQEASKRKNEPPKKNQPTLKGLKFISKRLQLSKEIEEIKSELSAIKRLADSESLEADDVREQLLKRNRAVKRKIENLESWIDEANLFFGMQYSEKGQNLVMIFKHFRCSSHSVIRACNVEKEPSCILMPDIGKKITVNGLYTISK